MSKKYPTRKNSNTKFVKLLNLQAYIKVKDDTAFHCEQKAIIHIV